MNAIKRANEKFFIEYFNAQQILIVKNSFEEFLKYMKNLRKERVFGLHLIFKNFDILKDMIVDIEEDKSKIFSFLESWYSNLTNYSLYYLTIDNLIFFDVNQNPIGCISYSNDIINQHFKINKYFFENKNKFINSTIFDQETIREAKNCYYNAKKFIDLITDASEKNPLISKFEEGDLHDKFEFQTLVEKTKKVIEKMERQLKSKNKNNIAPLIQVKEVYELISKQFVY